MAFVISRGLSSRLEQAVRIAWCVARVARKYQATGETRRTSGTGRGLTPSVPHTDRRDGYSWGGWLNHMDTRQPFAVIRLSRTAY